jgi:hypothetical protein
MLEGGGEGFGFCWAAGEWGGGLTVESDRADNFLLAVTGISLNRWG